MSVVKENTLYIEVGSTCLKDFLKTDSIEKILWTSSMFHSIEDILSEGRDCGGRVQPVFELKRIIAIAVHVIKEHGYVSRVKADELGCCSTSSEVMYLERGDSWNKIEPYQPTTNELKEAEAIIEYTKTITTENDYKYNLKAIADSGYTTHKTIGYAVSMVSFYNKAMELYIKKDKVISQYVGEIGKKETLKLTFISVYAFEGFYGMTFINRFQDENGNIVIWKTSTKNDFEIGKIYDTIATIKSYDEYKNTKQTYINRPKFK